MACDISLSRTQRPLTKKYCASRVPLACAGALIAPRIAICPPDSSTGSAPAANSSPITAAGRPGGGWEGEGLWFELQPHAAVVRQRKRDIGPRQRNAAEGFLAMREFGLLGFQELAPRRSVEIQL